jgi:uncharacterized protein YcfL
MKKTTLWVSLILAALALVGCSRPADLLDIAAAASTTAQA